MKLPQIALTVLLSFAVAFATVKYLAPQTATSAVKESAFERVMRTKTLNCAYMLWTPFMMKDPNTGSFKGMNYDMMNAIGESLGLKINWVAEIAPGTQVDTLTSHKADAICSSEGPIDAAASAYLAYTNALAYFPFYAYVRSDDTRFNNAQTEGMNDPSVRIAVIDGDVSSEVVRKRFPKAQQISQAQFTDPSSMMLNVITNKADVVLNDELSMAEFLANNPGKLRKLNNLALVVIPNTFSVLRTEQTLKDMISQGLQNIQNRGEAAVILAKYGIGSEINLYPPALPYKPPQ